MGRWIYLFILIALFHFALADNYTFIENLDVRGDGCKVPNQPDDYTNIFIPTGGGYLVRGQMRLGQPIGCQDHEHFYLSANGMNSSYEYDFSCANITKNMSLGIYPLIAGFNEIGLHHLSSCPPDTDANSVHLEGIFLYEALYEESCKGADKIYDIEKRVYGCPGDLKASIAFNIDVEKAGHHLLVGEVVRGNPSQCQDNEIFYLEVGGVQGPIALDDPEPCLISLRNQTLGTFDFTTGSNEVTMSTAVTCPPYTFGGSVELRRLCIYYDKGYRIKLSGNVWTETIHGTYEPGENVFVTITSENLSHAIGTKTNSTGEYEILVPENITIDIAISKPGFAPYFTSIYTDKNQTVNASLGLINDCRTDCTRLVNNEFRCAADCDGINGCRYNSSIVSASDKYGGMSMKELCDGGLPGWTMENDVNTAIKCCNGGYVPASQKIPALIQYNSDLLDLQTYYAGSFLFAPMGDMVSLYVTIFSEK